MPVVGSAAAGISAGVGQFRGVFGGAERRLRQLAAGSRALRGVSAGAGCGVGVGYGFGAGLFLKPGVGEALLQRLAAARESVQARLPAGLALPGGAPAVQQAQQQPWQQQPWQQQQAQQQQQAGGSEAARVAEEAERALSQLRERVAQLSDSLAAVRAEQRDVRAALCAAQPRPAWAEALCERRQQ